MRAWFGPTMRLRLVSALSLLLFAACSSDPATDAGVDAGVTDVVNTDVASTDVANTDAGEDIQALIRQGRQTAQLCAFCHSTNGVYSGQTDPRPMSTQYGANLTPDNETGIGMWTDEEITRAVRQGTGRDGRTLCNLMTRYTPGMLSDASLRALIVFLRNEAPVRRVIPRSVCP